MTIVLGAPDRVRDRVCWPVDDAANTGAASSKRALTRGRLVAALIAALGVALSMALQDHANGANSPPSLSAATARPAWIEVAAPPRVFALAAARAAASPFTYAARRSAGGDEREDILTAGTPDGSGPYVRLLVHRGPGSGPAASLFLELARRAAETDLAITRAAQPFRMPTRLGTFEVARVTAAGGTRDMACLGFRSAAAASGIAITGLACGGDKAVDTAAVACLIDGLSLVDPAGDRALREVFGRADQRRACPDVLADRRIGSSRPPYA
jgi:hypothetical protein